MSQPVDDPTPSSSFDQRWFRDVLGYFPTGVSIVTGLAIDGRPMGLAVGSFTSVSLEPPLVALCPGKSSSSWAEIEPSGLFCVNVLAEDQEEICRVFATKGIDKFATVGWRRSPNGAPIVEDALAWIDCRIDSVHEVGDHYIVIGLVENLAPLRADARPLVFHRGRYGRFEA